MDYVELLAHSLYLNITISEETPYLEYLIATAKETILNALDTDVEPTNNTFKHAVILLAGHYYENRIEAADTTTVNIPFGVASLIQQLQAQNGVTE